MRQLAEFGGIVGMLRVVRQQALSVTTVLAFGVLQVQAADLGGMKDVPGTVLEEPAGPQWEAAIAPLYGWLTGMRGDVGVLGIEASVSVSPRDILSNLSELVDALDGYYMGSGHIRNGRFGFLYDAVYLKVSSAQQFAGEASRTVEVSGGGGGPIGGPDLSLSIDASVDGIADVAFSYTMATLAGTYRVYQTPKSRLDFLAGVRITDVDLKVGVVADAAVAAQAGLKLGPISKTIGVTRGNQVNATAADGDRWVDPIIGVAGRTMLHPNWYFTGWAMIGGFGVNSQFLYDVMGVVGYEWQNGMSVYGGYRIADTDYTNGGFKWDLALHGPIVGFSAKF